MRSFLHSVETSLETNLSHGIARDIAQGMALLHSKNAIHGDLKSSNVLLTRENRAKVSYVYMFADDLVTSAATSQGALNSS